MIYLNTARNNVTFEKSVKQIIKEAPNAELKNIIKDATDSDGTYVIRRGIPSLIEYAQKGEHEREQAVKVLRDIIDSEEVRKSPMSESLFYGAINMNIRDKSGKVTGERFKDQFFGYLGAYEKLTGVRLNVVV